MLPKTKESLLAAIKAMEMQIKTLKTLVENEHEFGLLETIPPTHYPWTINCDLKETSPSKEIKVSTTYL